MSTGAAIAVGAVTGLALGILLSVTTDVPLAPEVGLVKSKKRGRVRTYEIAPERFKVVEDWLTARRQLWEARLDRFDQHVKQLKEKESES